MGYLEGLLGGFTTRKGEYEAYQLDEERAAKNREARVYEALLASPDPEIQAAAVTGLFSSAQPGKRKSGLRGWLGEMTANPAMEQIRALMQTPVQETKTVPGPAQTTGYMPQAPPPTGAAAQSTNSPIDPEGQPPTPVQPYPTTDYETGVVGTLPPKDLGPLGPDPRVATAPPSMAQLQTSRPRQLFRTPEQAANEAARGRATGDVEGRVAGLVASGMPEDQALQTVQQDLIGSMSQMRPQSVAGQLADGTPAFAIFEPRSMTYLDPFTHQPLAGFQPRPGGASTYRVGQELEAASDLLYHLPYGQLQTSEQKQAAYDLSLRMISEKAANRTGGAAVGKFNAPMDAATAMRVNAPTGTTSAQLAGQTPTTQQEEDRRRSITSSQQALIALKAQLAILPSARDIVAGRAPGMYLQSQKLRDPAGAGVKIAALEAAIDNVLGAISSSVQLNRGAVTENDIERARSGLLSLKASLTNPLAGDTQESALARIQQTEQDLYRALKLIPPALQPGVGQAPPGGARTGAPGGGSDLDQPVPGLFIRDGKFVRQ